MISLFARVGTVAETIALLCFAVLSLVGVIQWFRGKSRGSAAGLFGSIFNGKR